MDEKKIIANDEKLKKDKQNIILKQKKLKKI